MNILTLVIGLTFVVATGLAQRTVRQGQQCYTPENNIGQCFTLSFCPGIANVLNYYQRNVAVRYLQTAQRSCGNINFRGDPVVCCELSQQQFQTTPIEPNNNPNNPFFPTTQTQPPIPQTTTTTTTTTPSIIIINPTVPTTSRPTTTTTTIDPNTAQGGRSCIDPDANDGVCTPLAKCPALINKLRSNPSDVGFARYLRASNQLCGEYAVVCCPNTKQPNPRNAIFPRNTNEIPTRLLTMADGCGYVNNEYKKIVGGQASKPGAWPWIALIGYDDGVSAVSFKCGGTLITSRHVLTAAHCIRSDLTTVRLGEHDLSTDSEANHIDVPVVKVLRHPQYNRTDGHNDIALLYLDRNVEFTEKITPICVPADPEIRARNFDEYNPFVAGWGKTQEGGRSATILQELQLTVLNNKRCSELYRKQGKFISEQQFDNAVICAGELAGGKDTCQGDSGGPLMLPVDFERTKRFQLIGVVSYGIGCARPNVPGVYARVTNFVEWIENGVANTP